MTFESTNFVIQIIVLVWFIRTIKFVLFWIYLWQLKEYHVGRFIDHFRTHKGKKLLLDPLLAIKIILLLLLFIWPLLVIYAAESLIFGRQILKRSVKIPKITFKTGLLVLVSLGIYGLFIRADIFVLLLFDIFVPIIVSLVVLIFQPFFVIARNRILKKAAKKIATYKNLTVIGITGSYGKTSTKEFLTTILSSKFKVLATPEHKNSEIGIAQTILNDLNDKHQIFIVEMGSYNKRGIKLLCDMVKPKIGIVTGVNEQHLATFGSLENLLSAEGGQELVKALPKNGLIILNGDNKYCLDLYKNIYAMAGGALKKRIYTVQKNKIDSDIWTEDVTVGKESVFFIAKSREKELAHFKVNVLGAQQVQNLLGAILLAKEFGMTFGEIAKACENITQEQAGMTLKKGVHGINIIDASYSSNPDGVAADLDYLSVFGGKRVIVMPCLIELGAESAAIHRRIGQKISQVCLASPDHAQRDDLAIITTKDKFKEIKEAAVQNGMNSERILLCDKPQEILHHITTLCKEGDAVLLEGRVPGELIRLLEK